MPETTETTETTETKVPEITLDMFKEFLQQDEAAKKWIQSESDARIQQALTTYKDKTLPKLVDERVESEYQKKHPDESLETKALRELRDEIQKTKMEVKRERLTNYALKIGTDKKLPTDLTLKLIGEDETTTERNISEFEISFNKAIKAAMEEKLAGTGKKTPVPGDGPAIGLTAMQIIKMSEEERKKYDKNMLENIMKQHYAGIK